MVILGSLLKLYNGLKNLQRAIVVLVEIFLIFLIFIQVVLRYVLKAPLMGIEELMLFPTVWLYFIGSANASLDRTHIVCGVFSLMVKKPISVKLFNIVKNLVSLIILLWLLYWAYWYFLYALRMWKISAMLYIPMILGEGIVFVGILLMTIYTTEDFIHSLGKKIKEEA